MNTLKIIIADDHKIFRDGLKLLITQIEECEIISEACNGNELIEVLNKISPLPDLIFMDIAMPFMNGIEATNLVKKKYPPIKIIALTTFEDKEFFNEVLYAGADGYMLKSSTVDDFKEAISKVMENDNYFSPLLIKNISQYFNYTKSTFEHNNRVKKITKREMEVLRLLCEGLNNEEIGNVLDIKSRTVERFKANLMEKTNSANSLNLVIYSFKNGLVKN